MIVRTMEYQRLQVQERSRRLSMALQGVNLAIGASGAVPFKEKVALTRVRKAFQGLLDDLLEIGEPPRPERKLSLAQLRFSYGSRWKDHLDELREEDRKEVST